MSLQLFRRIRVNTMGNYSISEDNERIPQRNIQLRSVKAVSPYGGRCNGLPERRDYVHPGWVGGVPSAADNPAVQAGLTLRPGMCDDCLAFRNSKKHRRECLGIVT
jgi:hypothetical protein